MIIYTFDSAKMQKGVVGSLSLTSLDNNHFFTSCGHNDFVISLKKTFFVILCTCHMDRRLHRNRLAG